MIWTKKAIYTFIGAILLIGLVVVLIGLFYSAAGPRAASSTIDLHATLTPTPINPYAPSKYGLPDTIAGYKVFAVLPVDTVACSRPGMKTLILQASQTSVEDFLKASDPKALDTALRQAGLTASEVEIQFVGPGATLDVMISEIQKWNADRKAHGCVTSVPAVVPTWTP
jgi:hypothetical protein